MNNEKIKIKPGTLLYPLPAVMVTSGTVENSNIITIAWTGIINTDPAILYISVRKSRHSHAMISEAGEFVINLTTEALARATDFSGVRSGRDFDKAKEMELTLIPGETTNTPMIAESPINLECKVMEVREYPTHDMFIAEIVAVHADEELFDDDGRIRLDLAGMVAFNHGEYFGIKRKPIGRFGFSVMKKSTKKRINREAKEKRQKRNEARKRKA